MAQHDYVIANGTGAAVRSDLNNALAAIVSQNSGAVAPTTTYAYMPWADTTTGLFKIRNAANNGWITLYQLDGEWSTIALENGSAAAPSIYFKDSGTDTGIYSPGTDQVAISTGGTVRLSLSTSAISSALPIDYPLGAVGTPSITFTGDLNTGLWSPAADTIAASTGGTERLRIDSSGRVGIGTTTANELLEVAGNIHVSGGDRSIFNRSNNALTFGTNNTERGRWTADGKLLVGTSTARSNFFNSTYTGLFQVEAAGNEASGRVSSITYGASGTSGPILALAKHRSDSVGGTTIVQNGDEIGVITFQGSDGTQFVEGARISAIVDAASGADDLPSRLVFSTTADGASSPTERFRLSANGSVRVPGFYDFATASAANVNIDSDYIVRRSTSSIKYKKDVETIAQNYSDALLGCRPVWYRSKCDSDNPDWGWWGFIAEEVAAIDPRLVHWRTTEPIIKEDGSTVDVPLATPEPEGVQYDRFVPHLLNLIKRQKEQIEAMEARLSALEGA